MVRIYGVAVLCLSFVGCLGFDVSAPHKDSSASFGYSVVSNKVVQGSERVKGRPLYYWIGNDIGKMNLETANLVAGWTIGPRSFKDSKEIEGDGGWIQVGNFDDVYHTIEEMDSAYESGLRWISTDLENWKRKFTEKEAVDFARAITSREGLHVLQWNSRHTWQGKALNVLAGVERLIIAEMIYPTAEGLKDYDSIYAFIVRELGYYKKGGKPAVGLSIYTSHKADKCVSWDVMKIQVDAAKAAGEHYGNPAHPIAIFWSDVQPGDFDMDDLNRYIAP